MPTPPNTSKILNALPSSVLERLHHAGHLADSLQMPLYLVGGIVRDLMLNIPDTDIDLVVEGDGIHFAGRLAKILRARVKRHIRFGTATLILPDNSKLDVVTARSERYDTPAALPVITPNTLEHDLQRRDFTVNALAIRLNKNTFGDLVDLFDGQNDLRQGFIRILHDQSFIDDPTRLFRAVRFEQRLNFRMEASTLDGFQRAISVDVVSYLSGHRLWDQLQLLFEEASPGPMVERLDTLGVLQALHPALAFSNEVSAAYKAIDLWRQNTPHKTDQQIPIGLMYWLALLTPCNEETIRHLIKRLRLQSHMAAIMRRLSTMQRVARRIIDGAIQTPSDLYQQVHPLPAELVLFFAMTSGHEMVKSLCETYYFQLRHTKLTIDGHTLQTLMIPEGPAYSKILQAVLKAKLDGHIHTEKEERSKAREIWNRMQK